MMLTDAENIEPDAVGELDLLNEFPYALRRRDSNTTLGERCGKAVDANLYRHSVPDSILSHGLEATTFWHRRRGKQPSAATSSSRSRTLKHSN